MGKELSEMTLEELWTLFPIVLKPYNPQYREWYLMEKNRILSYFESHNIKRISHIGSTAVSGLISKPTVDILLEVSRESDADFYVKELEKLGWTLMSRRDKLALNCSFNKGYTKYGYADKVYHLHLREHGDWGELYFRDYLIEHQDIAKAYGVHKEDLMQQYPNDRDGYTAAKSEFIKKYTAMAHNRYAGRYAVE